MLGFRDVLKGHSEVEGKMRGRGHAMSLSRKGGYEAVWILATMVEIVPGEDEGAYLLDVESGELYSVNDVGAEVVRYLSAERTETQSRRNWCARLA